MGWNGAASGPRTDDERSNFRSDWVFEIAMPQFAYKARRRSGEVVQGVCEVADRAAALAQIERLGLFPVAIEAPRSAGGAAVPTAASAASAGGKKQAVTGAVATPPGLRSLLARKRKPKLQELATFTQQLANLLKAGMPLTSALQSMSHLQSKGIPGEVSRQLRQDVTEGKGLSEAMGKQGLIFSDMYVNMVRAGEQSGSLVEVLRRLAEHYERFAEVQHKVTGALIYPAFVMVVGIVIVFFFMTFMLPKFLSIFAGMKVTLPMSTQILIGISNFFSSVRNQVVFGILAFTATLLFMRFRATPEGRRKIDSWKMHAPVVGRVVRLNLFGQFARTLGTLLHNGVPVLTALKITEQVVPNVVLKDAIAATREAVTDGKTLAQPLARGAIFPQLMIDLIKIGEDTGDVPGALQNVAETYENELTIALRVMMNMIEPMMIIVIAVGVGFLLFSVLSAMFSITSNLGR